LIRRTLVLGAAIGIGIAACAGIKASADNLVPGGWLQPIQLPKPPPPPPSPPVLNQAAVPVAPHRIAHRRERVRVRRAPREATPPSDNRVRF